MPPLKDLTGQQFGRLTVLNKAESKNKKVYWNCRCNCGQELSIRGDSLTSGRTTSCGCYSKEVASALSKQRKEDLTNQKFGRLTVVKEDFSKNRAAWLCKCDCGNEIVTTSDRLKSGQTQSCGCFRLEQLRKSLCGKPNINFIDITGNKYGKLTVKSEHHRDGKDVFYNCICDCGNKTVVSGHHLRSLHTLSCGCLRNSYGEQLIKTLLNELSYSYETEKTFTDCVNPNTHRKLRFDFFIEDKILLEYDGEQHFKETNRTNLSDIQYRDEIKNQWCIKHNIPLIRISYKELKSINKDFLNNKIMQTAQEFGYSIRKG